MCHHAKCFSHVLLEHTTHSVEALLLHDSDNTHQKYHNNHTGRRARFGIMADLISSPLELPPLVYYAIHFTFCKPINPRFMKLGWYDANAHMSYVRVPLLYLTNNINILPQILDDHQSSAEVESTLVPDSTESISAENGPIVVRPPTNHTPELTVRHMKREVYVLVPPAPYRLPGQGSRSHRKSQAKSSTSKLFVSQDEIQPTVNRPEQRVTPSQEDGKVPKAPTTAHSPSLSDIGISIPTIVRKPGSFIMHTLPHIITQSNENLVEPVNPRTKPLHVGNPVTAQVITKASIGALKFKRSQVKPTPSSSNNTTIVASTDIKGGRNSPNLPQSQPAPPMPLPEVSNVLNERTAQSIANIVMDRVGFMLVSNYFDLFVK